MRVRTGATGGQYWAGELPIGATVVGLAVAGIVWVIRRDRPSLEEAALASLLGGGLGCESPQGAADSQ